MTRVTDDDLRQRFATRCIHAGQHPDPATGAIMPPIYQTSTYAQDALGVHKGYEYARGKNPTREAFERNVASLEGGRHGIAFASGMAAVHALFQLFAPGDHLLLGESIYGGTWRLAEQVFRPWGLDIGYVDTRDPRRVTDAITPRTRGVLVETPTNPLMQLTDLSAIGQITRHHGLLLLVDNTFATPYFQRPLECGADVTFHSTTKYLNGHSDMIGGVAVVLDDELATRLTFLANASGAVPGPFDCWLALRGTKTLPLRMRQHDANGRAIARWLADRLGETAVYYPGLPSHPQHELACRQMSGFGGLVTVDLRTRDRAARVLNRLRVFTLAESLGGVESLANHSASMSHAGMPPEQRAKLGIGDGIVRFSAGVEDADDLLEDLEQAFAGLPVHP